MDDPEKRTPERDELGDLDQTLWPIGSDDKPLDPWSRVGQLNLVRVRDGAPLVFEASALTACAGSRGSGHPDLLACARQRPGRPADPACSAPGRCATPKIKIGGYRHSTLIGWNEPDGQQILPDRRRSNEKRQHLRPKPSPEAMYAVGGAPPAAPRERKPRNAYAPARPRRSGAPTDLEALLDDEIPI